MTTDPIIRAGRRLFSPGPPTFTKTGPTTWEETPAARARCVFDCDERLGEGDPIACPNHRWQIQMTPFEPQRGVKA